MTTTKLRSKTGPASSRKARSLSTSSSSRDVTVLRGRDESNIGCCQCIKVIAARTPQPAEITTNHK
eukprot:2643910-Amphidinium_carterae.1